MAGIKDENMVQPIPAPGATSAFDLEGAIKSGYSSQEIAQQLSQDNNFDYAAASKEGYSDDEIIASLLENTATPIRPVSKPAAIAEGVARGLMVGAPATYGMIRGGMMGAQLGTVSPWPFVTAPLGAIAGGLVGLFTGSALGGAAESALMPEEPVGPEARPYLEGGKTFGATLPSVIIPYKLPAEGVTLGSRMYLDSVARMSEPSVKRTMLGATGKTLEFLEKGLSKAGEAARTTPAVFGAAETIAAGGAGLGGGLAESTDPGDIGTRLLYETIGGFFAPKKVLINFVPAIKNAVSNTVQPLTRAGRQDMAAMRLRQIFVENGEDIDATIKALRSDTEFLRLANEMGVETGEIPAYLLMNSPSLREIKNRIIVGHAGMSDEVKQATKNNLKAVESIIDILRYQGDPKSLAAAAQMRQKYFEELLTARLNAANAQVLNAAEKIPASQAAAQQAGQNVATVARQALKDARAHERALYQNVDRTAPVDLQESNAILEAYRNLQLEHPDIIPREIRSRVGQLFPQINQVNAAQDAYVSAIESLGKSLDKARTATTQSLGRLSSNDKFFLSRRLDPQQGTPVSRLLENPGSVPRERVIALRDEISKATAKESFGYTDANNTNQFLTLSKEAKKDVLKVLNGFLDLPNFESELTRLQAQGAPQAMDVAEEAVSTNLGQIMDFRSQMRTLGEQAAARGDFQEANFYGRLNEAALNDLETIVAREAADGTDPMVQPLFQAYQYSRALNDVFRRAFAGDVLAKDGNSRARILPETLAAQLFSEGNDAVALRSRQLIDAAGFMASKAAQETGAEIPGTLAQNIGTMSAAAEDMLRYAARNVVNPDTGAVRPEALAAFIRDNEVALQAFPSLLEDLSNAQTAQRVLDSVTDTSSKAQEVIRQQSAFAKFLNSPDNPAQTLQSMLGSPGSRKGDAVKAFKKLVRFAKRDGNIDVVDGLLDTVLERAYMYAGGSDGSANFNFNKFKAYLYEPLGKNEASIMEIMREQGVIPEKTVGQLRVALDQADLAARTAADTTGSGRPLIDAPAVAIDTIAALLGTRVGTFVSGMLPGRKQGIIEAATFAGLGREWLSKMPNMELKNIYVAAMQDPELLALLLEKAPTPKKKLELLGKFNAYLNGIGIRWLSEDEQQQMVQGILPQEAQTQEEQTAPVPQAQPQPQPMPTMQTPPPTAQAPAPMPAPMPAPAPAPQAQPNLQQRQQYAAMFPYESTSQMIRGGIGSLS